MGDVSGQSLRELPALLADPERRHVERGKDFFVLLGCLGERGAALDRLSNLFQDLAETGVDLPFDD
jgi:hypothetical protein